MMGEIMQFPETVEGFMQQYKITDTQQVYTNGAELVPIFRMQQWFEAHKQRWIPCSERLPEDGQDVLCWYQYFRYGNYNRLWQTYGIGFQYNGNWGGEVSTGRDTKVLFWMPLPEPPEEVQWTREQVRRRQRGVNGRK